MTSCDLRHSVFSSRCRERAPGGKHRAPGGGIRGAARPKRQGDMGQLTQLPLSQLPKQDQAKVFSATSIDHWPE